MSYNNNEIVDIYSQSNIVHLQQPHLLSEEFHVSSYIKQSSPEWHALRKLAPVTGSTLHTGIGLRTLKEQKNHVKMFKGEHQREFSPEVQEILDYGKKNEINGIVTLTGQVLPFYFPESRYFEEGAHFISSASQTPIIEVSPDGAIRDVTHKITHSVEVKCPIKRSFKLPVMYEIPHYYVLQVLSQMVAQSCERALFVSYSKESTTVSMVKYDCNLWNAVLAEVVRLYDKDDITPPTKISPTTKHIKELISKFVETNVELIIEVPSQTSSTFEHDVEDDKMVALSPYLYASDNLKHQYLIYKLYVKRPYM